MFERMTASEFREQFPGGIPLKKGSKRRCSSVRQRPVELVSSTDAPKDEKKQKYGNNKKEVNDIVFHSEKEADRYLELRLKERLGEIEGLTLQPCFILAPAVKFEGATTTKEPLRYFADFTYYCKKRSKQIIEDVKSTATARSPVYRIKKHLMKSVLGLEITEF